MPGRLWLEEWLANVLEEDRGDTGNNLGWQVTQLLQASADLLPEDLR